MKASRKERLLLCISKAILKTARKEADSACMFMGYQPKMPDSVKKLNTSKEGRKRKE